MRNKLWILTALLVLTSIAHCQGGSWVRQVVSGTVSNGGTGQVIPNAIVRVCTSSAVGNPCSPLASIYSDQALTQPLSNPLAADTNGVYGFYVSVGGYVVQESAPLGAGYTFSESYTIFSNGQATVSSVGLSMPGIFTVSGSPITSTGTFNVSFNSQSANTVFGNCTGSSAVPSFCSLTANMVPGTLNSTTFPSITTTAGATIGTTLNVGTTSTLTGAVTASTSVGTPFVDASTGYKIGGSYGTSGQGLISTGTGTQFGPVSASSILRFSCGPSGVSTTPLYCGSAVQDGSTELNVAFPAARTGTLANMYCFVYPTPGVSQSFLFTLDEGLVGGMSSTGITCTANSGNNGECGDLVDTYAITNGVTLLALHVQPSGTTSAVNASCSVNFQ